MFSVVAMETFKLLPEQNGYMMSYIGILTMVSLIFKTLYRSYTYISDMWWSHTHIKLHIMDLTDVTLLKKKGGGGATPTVNFTRFTNSKLNNKK